MKRALMALFLYTKYCFYNLSLLLLINFCITGCVAVPGCMLIMQEFRFICDATAHALIEAAQKALEGVIKKMAKDIC
jgi:ABC-type Mn2+/Zn2+ transport system permease subunit